MTAPFNARERAVLAEQETDRHARLALAGHDTDHDLRVMVETKSALDDHYTEGGYCPTCQLWIVRTTFVNGRVEDTLMPVDQRNELQRDTTLEETLEEEWDEFPRPYSCVEGQR